MYYDWWVYVIGTGRFAGSVTTLPAFVNFQNPPSTTITVTSVSTTTTVISGTTSTKTVTKTETITIPVPPPKPSSMIPLLGVILLFAFMPVLAYLSFRDEGKLVLKLPSPSLLKRLCNGVSYALKRV